MSTHAGNESLLDRIATTPRRETGGAVAANRTDYQQSWAFCLLLTLHEKPNDYAVLLDFHDDVVVLDSAEEAKGMEFYQVKSKESGNWTITQLLRCPKGKDEKSGLSICGKMYANKLAFPNVTKSVNFVSNLRFKVHLNGAEKEVEVDEFEVKQLAKEMRGSSGRNAYPILPFPCVYLITEDRQHFVDSERLRPPVGGIPMTRIHRLQNNARLEPRQARPGSHGTFR